MKSEKGGVQPIKLMVPPLPVSLGIRPSELFFFPFDHGTNGGAGGSLLTQSLTQ